VRALTKNGSEIILVGNDLVVQSLNMPIEKTKVLVVGVFHGNEPQGDFLIKKYLQERSETNLLFIPCLNPDGMALGTRGNANGVDLNRNFPTANWSHARAHDEFFGGESPASEIETRFLIEVIEKYKPQLILTLHAPFKVVNYDGDAREISEKISEIIGYPVQEDIGYPTPGSFGTYAGVERAIPTITLELDETVPVETLIKPVHGVFEFLEKF